MKVMTSSEYRIRKNVVYLNQEELEKLREAFKGFTRSDNDRGLSYYAGLYGAPAYHSWHHKLPSLFLPWNRAYLYNFETGLRRQVPGVSIPWWDWSSEPSRQEGIPNVFAVENVNGEPNPLYKSHVHVPTTDPPIDTDTFREPRRPTGLPNPNFIDQILPISRWDSFSEQLEDTSDQVHGWTGGTMGRVATAAYDPLFYSHSTNIDRIWWLWQLKNGIENIPKENLDIILEPFSLSVKNILDIKNLNYDYPQPESIKHSTHVTIKPSSHVTNDMWTSEDTLGYGLLVHSIYAFLTHEDTKPPLSVSIQGQWGGGKTSVMRMLQKELDPQGFELSKERGTNPSPKKVISVKQVVDYLETNQNQKYDLKASTSNLTIWFNAWKYQNSQQIWAGLANEIIVQFTERLKGEDREQFLLDLHLERLGKENVKLLINNYKGKTWLEKVKKWFPVYIASFGASAGTTFLGLTSGTNSPLVAVLGQYGMLISVIGSASLTAYEGFKAKKEIENQDAKQVLNNLVNIPDYRTHMGLEYQIEEDLRKVFKTIPTSSRLIIFIDDLDRCSPQTIAKIIEGMNSFLSAEFKNCIFVMGMDLEYVSSAIDKQYTNITKSVESREILNGWSFMNKFIQLPVILPRPDRNSIELFIGSLLKGKKQENEKTSRHVSGEYNDVQEPAYEEYKENLESSKAKIDETKESYSDQNPEVRKLIAEVSKEFPNNPREIKRFLNIFRFYYFLREGRKTMNLPFASLKQLRIWIILIMKWPQFSIWIQRHNTENASKDYTKNIAVKLLKILETYDGDSTKFRSRAKDFESLNQLKIMNLVFKNYGLLNFFKTENSNRKKNDKDRLSNALETGLY